MDLDNRGMALVSVLVILMVLMILAHILYEKVWFSTRQVAKAASRQKIFWAAQSGIEAARERLAETYATSANWNSYLSSTAGAYSSYPVWSYTFSGVMVDIFLRDNPDGDGHFDSDSDLKVFVLSRATGQQGAETLIEILCVFEAAAAQGGELDGKVVNKHLELMSAEASTYEIYQ